MLSKIYKSRFAVKSSASPAKMLAFRKSYSLNSLQNKEIGSLQLKKTIIASWEFTTWLLTKRSNKLIETKLRNITPMSLLQLNNNWNPRLRSSERSLRLMLSSPPLSQRLIMIWEERGIEFLMRKLRLKLILKLTSKERCYRTCCLRSSQIRVLCWVKNVNSCCWESKI